MGYGVGKTLDIARSSLGEHESPSGSNCQRFSRYWEHPCESWCDDWASWALDKGGILDVAMSAYTPTSAGEYQKAGRWGHKPIVGAQVFFSWPGMGRICHTGLVEHVVDSDTCVTLEGNTDSAGGGSGGQVMRHERTAYIVGYGYPQAALDRAHHVKVHGSPPKPGDTREKGKGKADEHRDPTPEKRTLDVNGRLNRATVRALQHVVGVPVDGLLGRATIRALQVDLNVMLPKARHVTVDGDLGPQTIRGLQRVVGATEDGEMGPETIRHLQRALNQRLRRHG